MLMNVSSFYFFFAQMAINEARGRQRREGVEWRQEKGGVAQLLKCKASTSCVRGSSSGHSTSNPDKSVTCPNCVPTSEWDTY